MDYGSRDICGIGYARDLLAWRVSRSGGYDVHGGVMALGVVAITFSHGIARPHRFFYVRVLSFGDGVEDSCCLFVFADPIV